MEEYLIFFTPELVDTGVTFASFDVTGTIFCWLRRNLAVIYDSGRNFVISFSVRTGHVEKDP